MSETEAERTSLSTAARAGGLSGGFVAVLYVIEVLDRVLPGDFESHGVHPRSGDGLQGIAFAPLLHGDWSHLISNSFPLLILGFLLALSGLRTWMLVTAIVWIIGGLGTWVIAGSNTIHIGASGVVFGWLVYLIVRGIFARNLGQIALGIIIFLGYGTLLLGVLPSDPSVSWEGHLFGAIGGAIAAWVLSGRAGSDDS